MASTNVSILVEAVDRASNVLRNIGKNIESSLGKQAQTNVTALQSASNGLTSTFSKLAVGAGLVGAGIVGTTLAVNGLKNALQPAIQASIQMENSMTALSRISQRFGEDAKQATDAARSLSEDGLISVATAADGLQRLMTAGLGLNEAVDLMKAYKDQAAFGRAASLDMDTAVGNLAESFMTESSAIGNLSGQSENYNLILERGAAVLGKKVSQLTEAERVEAKYIGTMQLGALVSGDAEVAAGTMGGTLSRLKTSTFELQSAFGTALSPAISAVGNGMINMASTATEFLTRHMRTLQIAVVSVTGAIQVLAMVLGSVLGAGFQLMTGNFKKAITTMENVSVNFKNMQADIQQKVVDIANKSHSAQVSAAERGFKGQTDASDKATQKMMKNMQDETDEFKKQLEKRNLAFKDQLDDLVRSHINKKNQLVKDLAEENADFTSKMSERAADFKETMEEIEDKHREKVLTLREQLAEETADYEEALNERNEKYAASIAQIEEAHKEKSTKLEREMQREREYGNQINNWKYLDLKKSLENEQKEYQQKLLKEQAELEKANAKAKAENDKKIADIQAQLTREEQVYTDARTKAMAEEAAQTLKLQEEHNKRVAATQAQLDAEKAILDKHNGLVAEVQNKVVEDDITRLIQKHERENKEAEEQHAKRMKDLQEQGSAEGNAYGGAIGGVLDTHMGNIKKNLEDSGKQAGLKFGEGIVSGAIKAGEDMVNGFFNGIKNKINDVANKTGVGITDIAKLLPGGGAGLTQALRYYGFKQAGGIVPGPIGAPVPIMAHGGEIVTSQGQSPKGGASLGGGITINLNIGMYAGTESEKRNVAKALYSSLVELAQSQHKTVQQLMEPHTI